MFVNKPLSKSPKSRIFIYYSIFWSVFSVVYYLLLGVIEGDDGSKPLWYRIGAYTLQNIPTMVSGILCFRNGLVDNLLTAKRVWFLLGLSMFLYLIGNIFFSLWELVWDLDPSGSIGDFFFIGFYVLIAWAMVAAIGQRGAKLKFHHWLITTLIAIGSIALSLTVVSSPATATDLSTTSDIITQSPLVLATTTADIPGWVMAIDDLLEPIAVSLNFFYIICDVILLIFATIMIFAFRGSRLGKTWQFTAQGVVCLYIADMWLAYASNQIDNYQSGFIIEIFWTLGMIQFGIAAVLEFDNNLEAHRIVRRKHKIYHES